MNLKFVLSSACLALSLLSTASAFAQVSCSRLSGDERTECDRRANYEAKCRKLKGGDLTKCTFDNKGQTYCNDAKDLNRCNALVAAHSGCRSQSGEAYATCMRNTKLIDR